MSLHVGGKHKIRRLLVGCAMSAILLLTACGESRSRRQDTGASPTSRPTIDASSFQATVQALATLMPTFTPYGGQPDEKSDAEQRNELLRQAAATVVARDHLQPILEPLPTPMPPLTPWPASVTRVAGAGIIVETNLCSLHKLIGARNEWSETIGNQVVGVCAGTSYSAPAHGQILVEVFDKTTNELLVAPSLYTVPAQVEWVKVIDAVGGNPHTSSR